MTSRLYRFRRGARLHSFGDPISEVPILGVPLGVAQREAAQAAGMEIVDVTSEDEIADARFLSFEDDLYFTPSFLRAAVESLRECTGDAQAAVVRSAFNDSVVLPTGPVPEDVWRLGLYVRDRGSGSGRDPHTRPRTVTVDQEVFGGHPTGIPDHVVSAGDFTIDLSDCFAGPVPTPFHLLHVNIAALLSRFAPSRRRWPEWIVSRFASPRSRGFYRALRRQNRIGKGCRIHPTAVVEGATLGDGVSVGAHAVVRLAHVGGGTTLEDQSSVTLSVLGENNYVANKNHIAYSLSYEDVFAIHGPYQFSVFGRRSAVFAVIACDVRLDGRTIGMPTKDGVIDSNRPLLGNVYGHDVKVGGGNIIAPGRVVPNGLHIPPPPGTIIYSFETPGSGQV